MLRGARGPVRQQQQQQQQQQQRAQSQPASPRTKSIPDTPFRQEIGQCSKALTSLRRIRRGGKGKSRREGGGARGRSRDTSKAKQGNSASSNARSEGEKKEESDKGGGKGGGKGKEQKTAAKEKGDNLEEKSEAKLMSPPAISRRASRDQCEL